MLDAMAISRLSARRLHLEQSESSGMDCRCIRDPVVARQCIGLINSVED